MRRLLAVADLPITATAVRAAGVWALASLTVETTRPLTVTQARSILEEAPGIVVEDDLKRLQYPYVTRVNGQDVVFVGRIRADSVPHGLQLWIVADICRGAALSAVQIAEHLPERAGLKPYASSCHAAVCITQFSWARSRTMGVGRLASSGAVASIVWQARSRYRSARGDAVWPSFRRVYPWHAARSGDGISAAPWPWPSSATVGAEFPCQYLWTEIARRGVGHLGQCRGQYARDDSSRGTGDPGSIFDRTHTRVNVF